MLLRAIPKAFNPHANRSSGASVILVSIDGMHALDMANWSLHIPTSQVAPLLLRALGIEKFDLEALHREHTPALPGIF